MFLLTFKIIVKRQMTKLKHVKFKCILTFIETLGFVHKHNVSIIPFRPQAVMKFISNRPLASI